MPTSKPSRRHFTDAARAAAVLARQRKREQAPPNGTPEVYVARLPDLHRPFGWEIRRFGGIVLEKSRTGYPTIKEAHSAGREALASLQVEA